MTEPLDPDTLAHVKTLVDLAAGGYVWIDSDDLAALLAVARDHARLTALIAESRLLAEALYGKGIVDPDLHQIIDAALSAEAGDPDD